MEEPLRVRPLPRRPARGPDALTVPASLEWWRRIPGGADWLDRLPRIVAECAEEWSLRLGEPYEAHVSYVARADCDDGTPAVLKVNFPDAETEHEADALAFWSDDASVRLLESSPERRVLLVERCDPGTQLWARADDEALEVARELLPMLWRAGDPGPPFRRIADEAPTWAETLGEFGVVSLVRDRRPVDSATLERRLDALTELGLDRERMRRWSLAHALWWSADDTTGESDAQMVEAARLLL